MVPSRQRPAGEVALTPFHAALRTVRDNGLEQQITVRQANGLEAIEAADEITAISICGMGGETIRDILESERGAAERAADPAANGGEQPLRQWLMDNHYRILCEELLQENGFYYEIIVAERAGPVLYTAEELYFGPCRCRRAALCFWASGNACCFRSRRS